MRNFVNEAVMGKPVGQLGFLNNIIASKVKSMGTDEALTFSCAAGDNADFLCDQGKCGWTKQTDGFWYSWTFPTKLKVSGISGVAREGSHPEQRLDILYKKPGDVWWSEIANFVCGSSNEFFEFYFSPIEIVALKFEVHPNETGCDRHTNKADCETAGCSWFYWDDTCRPTYPNEIKYVSGQMKVEEISPPPKCSDYDNQIECEENRCFWYDGTCHTNEPPKESWWWLIALIGIAAVAALSSLKS